LLKETPSKEIAESSGDFRDTARIINAPSKEISSVLQELYPEEAILVRTKEDKDRFSHLKFVFTVEEAKGLEFDTVFLVEFFTARQNLWTKVLSKQSIKDTEKVELRLELNLLYVAITRAKRVLNIWEEQPSVLWQQKELISFVQSITPELARNARIEPTKQAWLDRGIYYRESGFFDQAIECFEKAFEERLKLEVQVKLTLQKKNYTEAAKILFQLRDWEQAAQLFERIENWIEAAKCWATLNNIPNQKKCQAINFENHQEWELAALLWEEIGLQENAQSCWMKTDNEHKKSEIRAIEFAANEQWIKAAEQYELAQMPQKADECKAMKSKKKNQVVEDLNQHLCEIGVSEKAGDGKYKATKALILGLIPGWCYDSQEKVAYRPDQNKFKIQIDFDELENELSASQSSIQNLQQKAKDYLEQGEMKLFRQTISELKLLYPNNKSADFSCDQGTLSSKHGNYHQEEQYYNNALWHNPYHSLTWYNKGILYNDIKKAYNKAINYFDISIEIDPGDSDAYASRGIAYRNIHEYQSAIHDFDKALKIDCLNSTIYLNRGLTYAFIGNLKDAINDYTKAISCNQNDAEAYYNRAEVYWEIKQNDNAIMDFQKAANAFKCQGNLQDYQDSLKSIKMIREGYEKTRMSK